LKSLDVEYYGSKESNAKGSAGTGFPGDQLQLLVIFHPARIDLSFPASAFPSQLVRSSKENKLVLSGYGNLLSNRLVPMLEEHRFFLV
jgi:hypothetical protein